MATEIAVETHNLIGGKWVPAASGQTFENRNPADTNDLDRPLRRLRTGGRRARRSPRRARPFPAGRPLPAPKRGEILYRAAEILQARKEELARDMTREMGKVLDETRGDVQEAIDMTYFMAGEGRRLFGQTTPSELPNKFRCRCASRSASARFITPWNFPMAIPSWKIMPALILGNTVVIKPATDTPLSVVEPREASSRRPGCRRASSTW